MSLTKCATRSKVENGECGSGSEVDNGESANDKIHGNWWLLHNSIMLL